MHRAVFINDLCKMTFESWLGSVWSGNLDPLSECL